MKLHHVCVTFEFAAVAETEREAIEFAQKEAENIFLEDHASLINDEYCNEPPDGWGYQTLVYNTLGRQMTWEQAAEEFGSVRDNSGQSDDQGL